MSLLSRIQPAADTQVPTPSKKRTNPEDHPQRGARPKRKRRRAAAAAAAAGDEAAERLHTPWLTGDTRAYDSREQRLHHEIAAYVRYILPTAEEEAARRHVVACVERVVRRRFPRSVVSVFGSVATGLYLPCGDIDIVVDTQGAVDDAQKRKMLFQLASLLRRSGIADEVQVNHHARVPIVLFTTTPELGSLHVDISINNTDGLKLVPIVQGYLDALPALRPLIMVVKGFLAQRHLNSAARSGLSSYALTCMAISFLQLNPGAEARPMEAEALGALVAGFFAYYGSAFPYGASCICVREGALRPRAPGGARGLAIQCLVRPDNDVGRSAGRIEEIRGAFRDAHAALTEEGAGAAGFGGIVGITRSAMAHRERIRRLGRDV